MTDEEKRAKKAAQFRAWEDANRERRKAYKRALRQSKPERFKKKHREASAKRRAEHPEEWAAYIKAHREQPEQREKAKAYWKRSGDKKTAKRREIREALPPTPPSDDPKKVAKRAYMKAWREKNIDKVREQKRIWNNNRDRKCKVPGKLTLAEWRAIVAKQNGCCFDCGERHRMTIGHLVPLSKGGSHTAANIVAQCMPCNHKQGVNTHPSIGE